MKAIEHRTVRGHRRLFAQRDHEALALANLVEDGAGHRAELTEIDPYRELLARNDATDPELVKEFLATVEGYVSISNEFWEAPEIEVDEMRLNQLRALGYAIPELKNEKQQLQGGTRKKR